MSVVVFSSDYFPGLGWATSKTIWNELKPKWPLGFWDDWLRLPEQRKDRVTIRPEVAARRLSSRLLLDANNSIHTRLLLLFGTHARLLSLLENV